MVTPNIVYSLLHARFNLYFGPAVVRFGSLHYLVIVILMANGELRDCLQLNYAQTKPLRLNILKILLPKCFELWYVL